MVELQKKVDQTVGTALSHVLGGLSSLTRTLVSTPLPKNPKRILITRLWAMGESLLVLPMIQALRKKFPKATIDVLVTKRVKQLFSRVAFTDSVIEWGPKNVPKVQAYDVVIDTEPYLKISALSSWYLGKHVIGFDHSPRAKLYHTKIPFNDKQHEVLTFMDLVKPFGISTVPKKLVALPYTKGETTHAKKLLKKFPRPYIGICATAAESASYLRRWPKARFVSACRELIKKTKGTVVFIGTKGEREYVSDMTDILPEKNTLNAAGKTSLGELVALVSLCDAFVSNDTGPMHLAAAQGVPTLGLFGPNLPVRFAPFGKKNTYVYHKQSCSPCINVHLGEIDKYGCQNNVCMQEITVKEVVKKTLSLLKKKR